MELIKHQFSYYYGKDMADSRKIELRFRFIDKLNNINKETKFKIDTGACDVCINALELGIQQTEEEFISTHRVWKVQDRKSVV